MSERMFFPLDNNDGMDSTIAERFSDAPFFGLFDFDMQTLIMIDNTVHHAKDDSSPVEKIVQAVNPTTVFVQYLGQNIIRLFEEHGIRVIKAHYKTIREIIEHHKELEKITQKDKESTNLEE